jgi:hypothetical protein
VPFLWKWTPRHENHNFSPSGAGQLGLSQNLVCLLGQGILSQRHTDSSVCQGRSDKNSSDQVKVSRR